MTELKLSNIWDNWSQLVSDLSNDDERRLGEVFDIPSGKMKQSADICINALVARFEDSDSFRESFNGYDDAEANAIAGALRDFDNHRIIEATIKAQYMSWLIRSGKTQEDMNFKEGQQPSGAAILKAQQATIEPPLIFERKTITKLPEEPMDEGMVNFDVDYKGYANKRVIRFSFESNGEFISATDAGGHEKNDRVIVDKIKEHYFSKMVAEAVSVDFGPTLSKISSVDQLKTIIGNKVLFVDSTKDLANGTLDARKKEFSDGDNLTAFRLADSGRLEYAEFPGYSVGSFRLLSTSFTELTGENNNYGPKQNIPDEKIIAFIQYNCKKKNKISIADAVMSTSTRNELQSLVDGYNALINDAMAILTPNDVSAKYKDKRNLLIPQGFVYHNHDHPYNEIRFLLGDKMIYWNQSTYSSRPIVEEGSGKDAWLRLDKSFLRASNNYNRSGYNESWSVYKCTPGQKKQVYEKLKGAGEKWQAFVKLAKQWYNTLK
jgi:hypothetical protein